MRQRRMFLISLGKEPWGITKEAQPASISATRKMNVILAANGASFNKRFSCTLGDRKDKECPSCCSICEKHICPEHSDIVWINFAWLLLLLLY